VAGARYRTLPNANPNSFFRETNSNEASQAVWVMKEYGAEEYWSKLFDIRIEGFERVVGFTKSDEALVQKDQRLFSVGYLDLPIRCPEHIYLDTLCGEPCSTECS
jgi:hypothetical protein